MTIFNLTCDCKPEINERVWMWRGDEKRWHVVWYTTDIDQHVGHEMLAWKFWAKLEEPQQPEHAR